MKTDCAANAVFGCILWLLPNLIGLGLLLFCLEDDAHDRRVLVWGTVGIGTTAVIYWTLKDRLELSANEWHCSFWCSINSAFQLAVACSALTANFWRSLQQWLVLLGVECVVFASALLVFVGIVRKPRKRSENAVMPTVADEAC